MTRCHRPSGRRGDRGEAHAGLIHQEADCRPLIADRYSLIAISLPAESRFEPCHLDFDICLSFELCDLTFRAAALPGAKGAGGEGDFAASFRFT